MSIKLNKKELAKLIAKKKNTTNSEELENISVIFDTIEEELDKGNDVKIVGFGAFTGVLRQPRTVVNPATSEQFKVGKKVAFKFVAGKHIRDIFKRKNS